MPKGIRKIKEVEKVEEVKEIEEKVEVKNTEEVEEVKAKPATLAEAFAYYGLEFRPDVHRIIDLAKIKEVDCDDCTSLEDVLARIEGSKKKA